MDGLSNLLSGVLPIHRYFKDYLSTFDPVSVSVLVLFLDSLDRQASLEQLMVPLHQQHASCNSHAVPSHQYGLYF